MTELPAPLTPAGCNLQDFKFMPLDVARLRGSELASDETPEACWAAVLLWCASWHEIPAASIPDNDQWQAKHAGYVARGKVAKEWADVRAGALRGWIKCSDGRLYHPVVVEKAIEAWDSKLDQRWRSEVARIKKHCERHQITLHRPSFDEWVSQGCPQGHRLPVPDDNNPVSRGHNTIVTGETPSKGQGEGQRQEQGKLVPEEPNGSLSTSAISPKVAELQQQIDEIPSGLKYTPPDCPHQKILALWAEVLPEALQHTTWEGNRAVTLRARWKSLAAELKWPTEAAGLHWFKRFFHYFRQSRFLMGKVPPSAGHKQFELSLEWVVNATNFAKIRDGFYHKEG